MTSLAELKSVDTAAGLDTIPVIDLAPFIAAAAGSGAVVDAVAQACRTIGFFLVTGHGVDAEKTARLYRLARAFFDLPEDQKRRTGSDRGVEGGVSFAPIAAEALAATLGKETPGDYKESLNYGRRLDGDRWPVEPEGIEAAFIDYFGEMERLSRHLRAIFCRAIGLPEDYFEPAFTEHLSALRVINYPEQTPKPAVGQVRAGEHTDYGFLTILRSEASSGGLQVRTRAGQWLDAPNIEGAFVVNIADAMMRWTNDAWVSTLHRVVNPPEGAVRSRRQSIPFFLNPNKEAQIECLPAFCSAANPARYEPISYGDYIALKTRQAFRQ